MAPLIVLSAIFIAVGIFLLFAQKKLTVKLIGLVPIFVGLLLLAACFNLRNYSAFTHEELIAKVRCSRVKGQLYDMVLQFNPIRKQREGQPQEYFLKGDQWVIEGDILKWKPICNLLGLKTSHKITRITGRYLSAAMASSGMRTLYSVNGGTDSLWMFLYKYQKYLPFAEAVYGNGAFVFPDNEATFGLYVTTSGFIIKKITEP